MKDAVERAVAVSSTHEDDFAAPRRALRAYVFENLDGQCAHRAAAAMSEAFALQK
jgi:hypothetical protein